MNKYEPRDVGKAIVRFSAYIRKGCMDHKWICENCHDDSDPLDWSIKDCCPNCSCVIFKKKRVQVFETRRRCTNGNCCYGVPF